jgi:hypothetical protein
MFAEAFESDVRYAKTDPQVRLDRLRAKRIDWHRRVPINLSGWRKEMVAGLADLLPTTRGLISREPPNRRKFWPTVWQVHELREAVVVVEQLETGEPSTARWRELWGMLYDLEMRYSHGLGPTIRWLVSEEIRLTRRIAFREARKAQAARRTSGQEPQDEPDDLKAFDEAVPQ